jgi:hypothetical protein
MSKKIKFYAEIKSPPLENEVRSEIGGILRLFQEGEIPSEKTDSISKITIKTCKSRLHSYELAEKEFNKEAL